MFNTIIYKNDSKVVAITKEIEKAISPDKVTEMYDAIREEVEKNIVSSIHISSNIMEAALLEINNRYDTRTTDYILSFTLNGKKSTHRGSFTVDEMMNENRLYDKAWEIYQVAVARSVMQDTIKIIPSILKR